MSETVSCEVCKKEFGVGVDLSHDGKDLATINIDIRGFVCWSCYSKYTQKKNHTRMIREGK